MKNVMRDRFISTVAICRDSRWRGDGGPTWTEAEHKPWERPCKSSAQAKQLQCDDVRLLRRHAGNNGNSDVSALADRLDACSRRQPCTSGSCAVCSRAVQRWFVHDGGRLIGEFCGMAAVANLLMVTISPDFGQISFNQLTPCAVHTIAAKLRRLLLKAGVKLAFGGIDFSVNHDGDDREEYVQVHVCLFIPCSSWRRSDLKLRKSINKSCTVSRPLNVKRFDGNNAGLAYAMKYEFKRRVSYHKSPDDRRDNRSCINTRLRTLRGYNWVKLMLLIDRLTLGKRVFLIGVKRFITAKEVAMKLIR
jgi:hypothetical protein